MLSQEDILNNKNTFIKLLRSVTREGADIEGLIKALNSRDFFEAPASTKYHCNYEGGLCQHSLNVYNRLKEIVGTYKEDIPPYSEDSLIIVSLLHDLAKMNFYEKTSFSKKEYSENGSKRDEIGKFEWVTYRGYKVKEDKDRYIYGSHGQNSERIASYFIPLSDEESAAIIWHMGGKDGVEIPDLPLIYNKYNLVTLLHTADFLSTYIEEKI